jgi:copper(I)-binding protein
VSFDGLTLVTGERVELEPGDLHGMCLGLNETLVEGAVIDLRLNFARSGSIDLEVPVEQR